MLASSDKCKPLTNFEVLVLDGSQGCHIIVSAIRLFC